MPGDVGDALHDAERLEQPLDPVGRPPAPLVAVVAEGVEPEEALVGQQVGHDRRLLVERLHPHQGIAAVGEGRPPRATVALRVAGSGAVHVGGDRGHEVVVEEAADVEVAGPLQEVGHLLDGLVGPERPTEVERTSVGVGEVDVAGAVRCGPVEGGAQHQPPVEDVGEAAAVEVERAARPASRSASPGR